MPSELDKDLPLTHDRSRLDRLLAEVICDQVGERVFREVQAIPHLTRGHSSLEFQQHLAVLSPAATATLVRACGLAAQLANLAEDLHHNRRRRAHRRAGSPAQSASLARTIQTFKQHAISFEQLSSMLSHARIDAVLTAHPTEVQRQSVLDAQRTLRALLIEINRGDLGQEDIQAHETQIKRVF